LKPFRFNQLYGTPESKELIRKALTSAMGVGEALIPEHLEKIITNTAVRLVPELSVPVLRYDPQKVHSFDRFTALPAAGSAMGESSVTPERNGTYERATQTLKIFKRKGSVTGFLQATAKDYIDPSVAEMENHVQAFGLDLRTYMLFGNAGADAYSFSGLDRFTLTNRANLTGADQVPADLSLLDDIIDVNTRLQGNNHRVCMLMSPELLSTFSRHWTTVRDNRNVPFSDIKVQGGYRLESYRNVPILETSATRPQAQMTTVVIAATGAGSGIPDNTYYFRVAPVTWDGEQGASAASNSVTTSSNDTITLTFTAYTGALFYKVYCSTTSGSETLVKVVSAFTYDGNGTISAAVASIAFTANPTTVDTTTVPSGMENDIPLEYQTGDYNKPTEYLFLWDLDEFQGMGKIAYTNESGSSFGGLITPMEVANTDDNYPFLLKSYCAMIDAFEKTCYVVRGLRTK
jgi:hypothetical protein